MAPAILAELLRKAAPAAVIAIASSAVFWSAEEDAQATTFAPTFEVSVTDDTPGASSSIEFGFNIEAPDANFHQLVTFAPPEFDFADDNDVTTGAFAGTVTADATLSLVNGACHDSINVTFLMYEASTDITQTIPLYSGVKDFDGDGLVENIERYPSFLATIAPNIEPVQRLYGQLLINGLWVPLNFVVFEPGARVPLYPEFDESLGYPVVTTLLDPTAPIEQSSISDFCTPLSTTTELFGVSRDNPDTSVNEAGEVLHSNPPDDGEYAWTMFARSRWDADGDGIENDMDPCPYTADPDWDPRSNDSPGDADADGLPSSCDVDDNSYNSDHDFDTWLNRLDLCPLLVNDSSFYMYDEDNDGVGDECDRDPDDASDGGLSHRHQICLMGTTAIGDPTSSTSDDSPCPSGPDLPIPPRLSVFAPEAQAVGSVQSVNVGISDPRMFSSYPGVTVDFDVTGANPTSGSCLTNNNGHCEFNYVGQNAGTDVIEVSAEPAGVQVMQTLEVEWVVPPANDDFADAMVIDGLPFHHEQTVVGAAQEEGEFVCGSEQTVWYSYTPNESVFVEIEAVQEGASVVITGFEEDGFRSDNAIACAGPGPPYIPNARPAGPAGFPDLATYYHGWLRAGGTYHFQVSPLGGQSPVTIEVREGEPGDGDCDGDIDSTDALAALIYVAFRVPSQCLLAVDMNCDGMYTTLDALGILRGVAGLPVETGCG